MINASDQVHEDQSRQGSLYLPQEEHDACGVGFVADMKGRKSHDIIQDALTMLVNMEHRGACGCDPNTGDGAGILLQLPHDFFASICPNLGIDLPAFGQYGVGMTFFPVEASQRRACRQLLERYIDRLGLQCLGYRVLDTLPEAANIGADALRTEPRVEQVFVSAREALSPEQLERKLFVLRRATQHAIGTELPEAKEDFYFTSFSYKTIVYKGQFRTDQVGPYYPDLQDPRVTTALAMVHSRFSTNTFPKWRLAQPFRYIAHNGEINTVQGNVNWMRAKESLMRSPYFSEEELALLMPICDAAASDSANLDAIVELLVMSGRSLPHVMMMLIPEAWYGNKLMDEEIRAFYEYHATLMEPWDGPASVCFTDGFTVGATLDRNGLRPSRYALTVDDRLVMSSEAGALPLDPATVIQRGRLQPGRLFIADLRSGRILEDEEVKRSLARRRPYKKWLKRHKINIQDLPTPKNGTFQPAGSLTQRQQLFGITSEELKVVLGPMASQAKEPLGSMGADTPLAVLSDQSQHLASYFKQHFAQVSNPPIDPIRERAVMSLRTWIGGSKNVMDETPEHCRHIAIKHPILTNEQLAKLRYLKQAHYRSATIDVTFGLEEGLEAAVDRICQQALQALQNGATILILSDRKAGPEQAPIPMLMAVGAVHHFLIQQDWRSQSALVVETGDAREVHHFATLIGYGAVAINPYLAYESLRSMRETHPAYQDYTFDQLQRNYVNAVNKGLLKVMSKMGISAVQSYHGAQIFEILGIDRSVVDTCFKGSISRIGGLTFEGIAKEVLVRHRLAFPAAPVPVQRLEVGGLYQWKRNGEAHLLNPTTIHLLQKSTRLGDYELYRRYAEAINQQQKKAITLRSLFDFTGKNPIPIEEVEPVTSLFKRFATGAMSFGSLSHEAHSTLAIAMNRIGGKSKSGEGGEDSRRFQPHPNGDSERSAIKQVASGRFGVTSHYLSEAEELQIKMAQGAKPGEGGQLPGHKVDEWIGRVRYSTPGVGLISPPPHHDIYSIEDLAQLIFDLKNANTAARISVKLVSRAGVGTIAAGVAKAHADHILISGSDGGTGASPLSSIRHAGLPWEIGLAEAHQTLVKNNLRSRVTLQADGQVRTGRDLAIATLLGAEEWGVATAALIVEGCIMMRKCHLNTCPVGVATQDPELRALFSGQPEHLIHFFTFLAEDLREHMAMLGFRTIEEMVGQVDRLQVREDLEHWKFKGLDLSPILYKMPAGPEVGLYKSVPQDHGLATQLDHQLIADCKDALEVGAPVLLHYPVENTDRATGTMLSYELTKRYQAEGLPTNTIHLKFKGSAGQSFAAFAAKGIRFELEGEANDYLGKGLSGSEVIVYPHAESPEDLQPGQNIIVGNVAFYGATSGEAYIRGIAGERFCVRNSGVQAVVEGLGDHGCEYMTGGTVVVLGPTGRNFAAGMSGGVAYIYDPAKNFIPRCNQELVEFDPLDFEDTETLKRLINRHHAFTGSRIALKLMTDWETAFSHFTKVIPTEYKAVMAKRRQALNPWQRDLAG
jgi:glutamate synthase (NADPH) large chain